MPAFVLTAAIGFVGAKIGRAAQCAEVASHHGELAAALQAGFQRLSRNFAFGQPGLARFLVQGVRKLFTESNR